MVNSCHNLKGYNYNMISVWTVLLKTRCKPLLLLKSLFLFMQKPPNLMVSRLICMNRTKNTLVLFNEYSVFCGSRLLTLTKMREREKKENLLIVLKLWFTFLLNYGHFLRNMTITVPHTFQFFPHPITSPVTLLKLVTLFLNFLLKENSLREQWKARKP